MNDGHAVLAPIFYVSNSLKPLTKRILTGEKSKHQRAYRPDVELWAWVFPDLPKHHLLCHIGQRTLNSLRRRSRKSLTQKPTREQGV